MSKYRIEIVERSSLITAFNRAWCFVLLAAIWSWKADIVPLQALFQSGLSFILLGYSVVCVRRKKHSNAFVSLLVNESGELEALPNDNTQWQISDQSKLAGPFLYLHLKNRFVNHHQSGRWLGKDQFDDIDFRRLCRVICRCQRSQKVMTV